MTRKRADDWRVTVCDACLTASCWHGEFYCERYRSAGTTTRWASELRELDREHPDHFSREHIGLTTGARPPLEVRR